MEYRSLGRSGLKVPVFSFGTATFGGGNEFFKAWGETGVAEARRLVDICIEMGLNLFDTADVYSDGVSEEIVGQVLEGRRQNILLATKATFPMFSKKPNEYGSSRIHLIRACEGSLKRLRTDCIDLYYMHGFDATTPIEETLRALEDLVRSGKIRYIGCSNFSGWHLMKSLSLSERYGWSKYVAHQVHYSLVGREFEWELMPLGLEEGVGAVVWSPLAGGALSGKIRRNQPAPQESRLGKISFIPYEKETLYSVIEVLDEVSKECGRSIPQVALNWILRRPGVSSVVIGARNVDQLQQNLGALEWKLTPLQILKLEAASERNPIYPYWHQRRFPELGHTASPVLR